MSTSRSPFSEYIADITPNARDARLPSKLLDVRAGDILAEPDPRRDVYRVLVTCNVECAQKAVRRTFYLCLLDPGSAELQTDCVVVADTRDLGRRILFMPLNREATELEGVVYHKTSGCINVSLNPSQIVAVREGVHAILQKMRSTTPQNQTTNGLRELPHS